MKSTQYINVIITKHLCRTFNNRRDDHVWKRSKLDSDPSKTSVFLMSDDGIRCTVVRINYHKSALELY